ncbi:hypothetical protein Trydic_g7905 [Trypoxylus dichotomus]
MQTWLKISLLLCFFGFLKEIRPSEPFIYEFLIGEWRNITSEEVTQYVYPVGTYSYLAQLVIVFLITDLSRYKPLIVVLGLSGIVVWAMLLWTKSLVELQILEVFYGTFMATEVAYYTYIYAKVPNEFYQQVTSHTRAAILTGRALSAVLAQLLVSFNVMDYRELNYITFAALIFATIWAIFLPNVPKSIYFHRMLEENQELTAAKYKTAFSLMKKHLTDSFSNRYVLKWSVWWALATAGFIQIQTYMQPLWAVIKPNSDNIYNGAVEALLTMLGAIGALLAGCLRTDWKYKGELVLSLCSITAGAIMLVSSQTEEVFVSYAAYVGFGAIYHFMITIASTEIAKYIMEDSYGLVFGLNTLVALVIQTFLTLCFVSGDLGLALDPRDQFLVYGFYHIVIASIYIIIGLASWIQSRRSRPV